MNTFLHVGCGHKRKDRTTAGFSDWNELRFDIDERGAEAVVIYDATISGERDRPVRTRRFEARVPAGSIDAKSAGRALNKASNQIANDVADWLKS